MSRAKDSNRQVDGAQNPAAAAAERRGSRRLHCRTPVRVYARSERASDSFVLLSSDVSPEGVFLESDLLFPEGELLDLELVVPGKAHPVRGLGRVVRVESSPAADGRPGPGMAVALPEPRGWFRPPREQGKG